MWAASGKGALPWTRWLFWALEKSQLIIAAVIPPRRWGNECFSLGVGIWVAPCVIHCRNDGSCNTSVLLETNEESTLMSRESLICQPFLNHLWNPITPLLFHFLRQRWQRSLQLSATILVWRGGQQGHGYGHWVWVGPKTSDLSSLLPQEWKSTGTALNKLGACSALASAELPKWQTLSCSAPHFHSALPAKLPSARPHNGKIKTNS